MLASGLGARIVLLMIEFFFGMSGLFCLLAKKEGHVSPYAHSGSAV